MDDLISRQDAIDVLEKDKANLDHIIKRFSGYDVRIDRYVAQHNQLDYDIDAIRNLPSALPCPEGFDPEHLTEQDKKDILEALDWVKGTITEEVPSAEPESETGTWIWKHCVWWCSECGKNPTKGMGYVQAAAELFDYCPHCGVKMERVQI